MTTNSRPVIPSHGGQTPPNGTPPTPAWAVPQYQPTWQQTPNLSPEPPPKVESSGSLALLWVITVLSGVLGVVASSKDSVGAAGLLGFCGASLLVTLAVQALRHR